MNNPTPTTFKQLAIGDVFEFEATKRCGMMHGPWLKVSTRKYSQDNVEYRVGSINVAVLPAPAPAPAPV